MRVLFSRQARQRFVCIDLLDMFWVVPFDFVRSVKYLLEEKGDKHSA